MYNMIFLLRKYLDRNALFFAVDVEYHLMSRNMNIVKESV